MVWLHTSSLIYLLICFINLALATQKCVEVENCESYVNLLNYLSVSSWNYLSKKNRENSSLMHCLAIDNFNFTKKVAEFFVEKNRENPMVLQCLATDNFNFTRKVVEFFCRKNFYEFSNNKNKSNFFYSWKLKEKMSTA